MEYQAPMKKRVRAIEEIKRGQELINCLQSHHLNLPTQATHLSKEILHAFTAALSLLNSIDFVDDEKCKITQKVGSSNYMKRRFAAASHEHSERNLKRKKQIDSWTTVTPAPHADGHQWRKYGQKNIHNSNHPRSYYRCTYKDDQGCLATKFVQQEECTTESTTFRVVYKNKHTCSPTIEPQIIFSSPPCIQSNFFIFESKNSNHGVLLKKASNKEQALPMSPNKMKDSLQYSRDSCSSLMNSTLSDLTDVRMEDDTISSMDLLFSDCCGFEFDDVKSILDTL